MRAPFRIRKPLVEEVRPTAARRRSPDSVEHWLERVVKLVPSEVVAVYLAGRGYAATWPGIWSTICLALVLIVRIWGTREGRAGVQWTAVAVSAVSFVIWVYAIGGRFLRFTLPDDGIAYAAVLVWTVILPIFYKGD
jgi:hypothetical protein